MREPTTKIAIIDYGMGNLRSVHNAFTQVGVKSVVTDDEAEILTADKVVLPGVGSFRYAMETIRHKRLDDVLRRFVDLGKPLLGICLGMQLLVDWGLEEGRTEGLGFIPGHVEELAKHPDHKIPHIGFNTVLFPSENRRAAIFDRVEHGASFYFVHSYRVCCDSRVHVSAETGFGERFVSAINLDRVFGVQFHPEKSRENGLRLLENFASL